MKFGASWCGPCRMMEPTINALIEKYEGSETVEIVDIDVDEFRELTMEHNIRNVPTLLFMSGDTVLDRKTGTIGLSQIESIIEECLRTGTYE